MNVIKRFFIKCAGTDIETIEICPNSEQIKHAGLGTLVLIPAIVSFFSMLYAISTLSENNYIIFTTSVFWSFIIFSVDRYIVSSIHKPKINESKDNSIEQRNYKRSLILRIIFAGFIGIAVSHPITLLFFNYSIEEKLNDDFTEKVNLHRELINKKIDSIRLRENEIKDKIEKAKSDKICLEKLLTAEQSGEKVSLECGYSSGKLGYKTRAKQISEMILNKSKEVDTLIKSQTRINQAIEDEILDIKHRMEEEISSFETYSSKDYLAKTNALDKISEDNPQTSVVKYFIILFFVFLDILPVSFKAISKRGKYEDLIESQNSKDVTFMPYKYGKRKRDEVKKHYFDNITKKSISEMNSELSNNEKFSSIIDKLKYIYQESIRGFYLKDKVIEKDEDPQPTLKKDSFLKRFNAEITIFFIVQAVTLTTLIYTNKHEIAIATGTFVLGTTTIFLNRKNNLITEKK